MHAEQKVMDDLPKATEVKGTQCEEKMGVKKDKGKAIQFLVKGPILLVHKHTLVQALIWSSSPLRSYMEN